VELYKELRHSLNELEQSPDRAISVAADLLRHAALMHLVYNMLPAGRSVSYKLADEEETIPSVPEEEGLEPESAITASTDAIVEEEKPEEGRGELLVPFVPYARKFYLPQWVAFDEKGELLVKSVEEAESHIKSMQRFMAVLFLAVALAPYISADKEYTKKRYGFSPIGQPGTGAGAYQTSQIIARVRNGCVGNLNAAQPEPALFRRPGTPRGLYELRSHSRRTHHVCPCIRRARRTPGTGEGQPGYALQPVHSQTFALSADLLEKAFEAATQVQPCSSPLPHNYHFYHFARPVKDRKMLTSMARVRLVCWLQSRCLGWIISPPITMLPAK
jgi:hypothetical protein